MLGFLFILLVAIGNFAMGFALAVIRGHGPTWAELTQFRAPHKAPASGADHAHGAAH